MNHEVERERYHHGNLRAALLQATIDLITEKDLGAVSLRAVARRVGVTNAAPYHHFKDKTALLAEATADGSVTSSVSGTAPIGPAGSETISIQVLESDLPDTRISVSTMLVNTNDAFSGLNGLPVGGMAAGDALTVDGIAYDAGTEANTELAAEIPGPIAGGEGFNAARNDRADQVSMHAGVISRDDGLASSDLSNQHRFDNPVVRVRVERTN